MQQLIEELKAKLAATTKESLSAEERSKMMESAMQAEEKRQEMLHSEISQMSAIKFKRGNELHAMKLQKRHIDTEIQVRIPRTTRHKILRVCKSLITLNCQLICVVTCNVM